MRGRQDETGATDDQPTPSCWQKTDMRLAANNPQKDNIHKPIFRLTDSTFLGKRN
jgi:hypothetical protein